MAQGVSHWSLITWVRIRSHAVACEMGGLNGSETGLSPSSSDLPCQYLSISAPHFI